MSVALVILNVGSKSITPDSPNLPNIVYHFAFFSRKNLILQSKQKNVSDGGKAAREEKN